MKFNEDGNYIPLHNRVIGVSNELMNLFNDSIYPVLTKNSTKTKKAIIVGGISGAGKSLLVKRILHDEPDKKFIVVNPDIIRDFLPDKNLLEMVYKEDSSKYTQSDSGMGAVYLRNKCLKDGLAYIVDSTLRVKQNAEIEINKAKSAGYDVEVHLLAVSEYEAIQGVIERYAKQKEAGLSPRFVDFDFVKKSYQSICDTADYLEKSGVKLKIYNRDGDILWDYQHSQSAKDVMASMNNNALDWSDEQNFNFLNKYENIVNSLYELNINMDFIEQINSEIFRYMLDEINYSSKNNMISNCIANEYDYNLSNNQFKLI